MTTDLDISPKAVHLLAKVCSETGSNYMTATQAPKVILALSAENASLRAERDAAWKAGAEAMRERAAAEVAESGAIVDHPSVFMGGPSRNAIRIADAFARCVRALPIPEKGDEA